MEKVNELFAAPVGDIKLVGKIDNIPVFTSSSLKERYLDSMGKTDKTIPIFKTITKLVNDGTLIPSYSTHKIIQSLRKKQPVEIRDVAGMVYGGKVIYIFVEAQSNIFSFTSNNDLATITIHELIHYMAGQYLKSFYNIFKDDLESFYNFYFCKLLNCDMQKSNSNNLVKFINFNLEKRPFSIPDQLLKEYYTLISDTYKDISSLDEKDFIKIVTEVIVLIKLLQKLMESGSTQYFLQILTKFKHLITPLYVAYKHTKAVNPMAAKTLCFQELWSTSEVVAVPAMAKMPSPKVYKALSKL